MKKVLVEKKIVKKIYQYELKKTLFELIINFLLILFLVVFILILGEIIIKIFQEEKIIDLFSFFQEDFEVIKKYFFDNLIIFYLSVPKIFILMWLFFLIILLSILLKLFKKRNILKNKIISLINFFKKL